mgnify:CR=1 FL=1
MLATPPFWASRKKAHFRASGKPPVELVVADLVDNYEYNGSSITVKNNHSRIPDIYMKE